MDIALMWDYTDEVIPEDEVIAAARMDAIELGANPVSPSVGATLRLLTAALSARSVFEVGTGAGVSGLYVLQGMPENGVLTTIDSEGESQQAARASFKCAGFPSSATRVFNGRALDMMPRMNAEAYDLVILDGNPEEVPYYLPHATRMLRPGGVLVIVHAMLRGQVADPVRRDGVTVGMREVIDVLTSSEGYFPCMLPCSDGVLAVVKR
ncbi:O-methyltransferase [Boudabousia marimammalium]|uniref:Methyltransferase n=1 Tax=Boudabousia marimammalium TaxID=156892 RepID=A0A1Q5PM77_9ACTO|nr:O-methyltransferase [Boudabousia marimammalium]OKL48112.1 methyltransferase [Boudabousia marimammalium]